VPKDVRSQGSMLSDTPTIRTERRLDKQTTTSPLTWVLGVALIGLLIFFLAMRGCNRETQAPTSLPNIDTVIQQDTTLVRDTVAMPSDSVAATPPAPTAPRNSSGSSPAVALSTTSNFMAQEKLAELKADGNTNAYIREVKRNGVTVYQVRTRK
jgi:septal ring-binding cell division protein DamX